MKIINHKCKGLFIFALAGGFSLALTGTLKAQPLERVSASATAYSQNGNVVDNGKTTSTKAVSKHAVATINLLEQLVHDEFAEGNLASDSVPAGAVLNFNGAGFEIDKGTNQLVDVSDIFTWTVSGTNDISGLGSFLDKNGQGVPPYSQTDYYLVTVAYNDSASTGKLQFSVTGFATVTKAATTPSAKGKYTESGSISLADGTGQGFDSGPIVITGFTLTASGSATVTTP